MKKIFVGICILSLPFSVQAATCIGGKEYVGHNNHTYCYSDHAMNWWTAFQWCHVQGRHLVTPAELCDYPEGNFPKSCGNLGSIESAALNFNGWTSLGNGDGTAYLFDRNSRNLLKYNVSSEVGRSICY